MSVKLSAAQQLGYWLEANNPGCWVTEYRFHPERKFRLDWAYPGIRMGVELDGMLPSGVASHQTIKGATRDREKDMYALASRWIVARVTTGQVLEGKIFTLLAQIIWQRETDIASA